MMGGKARMKDEGGRMKKRRKGQRERVKGFSPFPLNLSPFPRSFIPHPSSFILALHGRNQQTERTKGRDNSMAGKKGAARRELIDTGRDKRYVRRDEKGRFDEVDDVSRSLSQDIRRKAKTTVPAGQGDKGDQKRKK
jgi:hypothetical protein